MNKPFILMGLERKVIVNVVKRIDAHTVQVKVLDSGKYHGCKLLASVSRLQPVG